mgnify:CR=1 FL=1
MEDREFERRFAQQLPVHLDRYFGRRLDADTATALLEDMPDTVRFYQKQVGQEAARILLQMLEENGSSGPVRQVTLGYQIVERGSL